MSKIHSEEVFECPDCEHREQDINNFKTPIFICDNCDSEWREEREAENCCVEEEYLETEDEDDIPEEE